MFATDSKKLSLFSRILLSFGVMLASSVSSAAAPIKTNFILGMDVNGQRLNLYQDCEEGSVTCDNMLLVAPDLQRLGLTKPSDQRLDTSPYRVKLYPAKTVHSLCKDGVSPCRFHGYSFEGAGIKGFIDPAYNTIQIENDRTAADNTVDYVENTTYLPLTAQASLIDSIYKASDKKLNDSYKGTLEEVRQLYGSEMVGDLKKEQIQWLKQRSKNCGADANHLPRTQAEKVCFIQQNNLRDRAWFLWID